MIDVGLRTEPNLELLTEMKPSFMVWSAGYGPAPEKLARIAPGRGFSFSDGKKPLAVARQSLQEMAQLLNLQTAAERHLAQYDTVIASLKPRFIHRGARPVLWHPCLIRGICWYLARTVCSVTCWTNTDP